MSAERIEGRTLRLWVIMQAMFEHARAGVAYEEDNDAEGRKRLRPPKAGLPRPLTSAACSTL